MNTDRYRIVVIGKKHPDLITDLSSDLFDHGCDIHTISSMDAGDSVVIALIIDTVLTKDSINEALQVIASKFELEVNISICEGSCESYEKSNTYFVIEGIASNNILKKLIKLLSYSGLKIHSIETKLFNINDKTNTPLFICNLKGNVTNGIDSLPETVSLIKDMDLRIKIRPESRLS